MKLSLLLQLVLAQACVVSLQAKAVDFKIKNNLKSPVEYGPMGIVGGAPINTDFIGGSRTLKAGGSTTEQVDNDQTPVFLFRVQGDPKLYQYAFPHTAKGKPYDKIDVVIEKGPTIKPASMITGIKTKDIIEMPYKEQPTKPAPQPKAPQKTPNQLLFDAAENGDIAAVQKALSLDANINAQDGGGMTALMWAAKANNKAVVAELIKQGANVMLTSKGENRRAYSFAQDIAIKQLLFNAEKAAMPAAPKVPQAPGAPSGGYANQKPTITPVASERIEAGKNTIQNEITDLNAKLSSVDAASLKNRYELVMGQFRALKSFLGSPANRKWAESTRDKLQDIRTAINKRIAAEEAAMQAIPQAPPLNIPQAPPLDAVPVIPQAPPLASKPASKAPKVTDKEKLLQEIQGGKQLKKPVIATKPDTEQSLLARELQQRYEIIATEKDEPDQEIISQEDPILELAKKMRDKFSDTRLTDDIAYKIAKQMIDIPNLNLNDQKTEAAIKTKIAEFAPREQGGSMGLGKIVIPSQYKKPTTESSDWND